MKYCVVIPVRLKSTRLPNKPLIKIIGKSMVQRTFERVLMAVEKENIFILTDSIEIFQHCKEFTDNVIMTPKECLTGTDRVAEFSKTFKNFDFYVNVQGDEPIINPKDITTIINKQLKYPECIINGFSLINDSVQYFSPHIPKMIMDENNFLLYSSRSPIPGSKSMNFDNVLSYRQICIYSFPKDSLILFGLGKNKSKNEKDEDIEVIRFLDNSMKVKMVNCIGNSIAVDTKEDLLEVKRILSKK